MRGGPAKNLAGPFATTCCCYWLQIANAVTLTAPEPATTTVAFACQAFVTDGADDWTAAALCPPLVTVAPPPSRTLPAAHVAVLVLDTVPAALVLAAVPGVADVTTVEPAIVPAGPAGPVAPVPPCGPAGPVAPGSPFGPCTV